MLPTQGTSPTDIKWQLKEIDYGTNKQKVIPPHFLKILWMNNKSTGHLFNYFNLLV